MWIGLHVRKMCTGSIVAAGVAMLVLFSVSPVAADARRPKNVERGADIFRIYCANCHGTSARGDGPTAEVLLFKPTDLTRISRRNGGKFPFEEVLRKIDGRAEIKSHGSREMPLWGIALQEWDTDVDQSDEVAGKLLHLTDFLKSIQVTGERE